jgi:hypothetical protein
MMEVLLPVSARFFGNHDQLTVGWVEGLEFNFLGAVVGFDIRQPALKFPGIGRLGMKGGV